MAQDDLSGASSSPSAAVQFPLIPAQEKAFRQLRENVRVSPVCILESEPAMGKTSVVARLVGEMGGVRIDGRAIIAALAQSVHDAIDEQLLRLIEDALSKHDLVVLDDVEQLQVVCSSNARYGRQDSFAAVLRYAMAKARALEKHLVLTRTYLSAGAPLNSWISERVLTTSIRPLDGADFRALLEGRLGSCDADRIDIEDIFEYAPSLNVQQLCDLAGLIAKASRFDAPFVRNLLNTHILSTNVRLNEVADITFGDLKGFEHIADALTTYVLNPLRDDVRLKGLGLRPKRGVLLYGPPGTGKTSVGRALAQQMQGKFFVIDGTFSPEPAGQFFSRTITVLLQAMAAAPCVLFIDDADVLLQSGYAAGFGRYFLSILDGLESLKPERITVILTAMDPSQLPPALLRSGRVELWLETRTPPEKARAEMIAAHLADLPENFHQYDADHLAELTDGFNAADMRRIVADVKALYATDLIAGRASKEADAYFERATGNVRRNKALLKLAEAGDFNFDALHSEAPMVAAGVQI